MATRAPRLTAGVGSKTDKGTLVTQATKDAAAADYAGVLQIREDNTKRVQEAKGVAKVAKVLAVKRVCSALFTERVNGITMAYRVILNSRRPICLHL